HRAGADRAAGRPVHGRHRRPRLPLAAAGGALMLEVRGVDVALGGTRILHGADLTAEPGQLVALVGPNGAGKSTLIRAAAGLQPVAAGEVLWNGSDVRTLRGRKLARIRAFVPQRPRVPEGVLVRDAVELGRAPHIPPLRRPTKA